jgi:hypothetical protein
VAAAEQERTTITANEGRRVVTADWVITFTFDLDPVIDEMDFWQNELEHVDASVARIPNRGVHVTVYAPGSMPMIEAAEKMAAEVAHVIQAKPTGVEVVNEVEWARRADAPTMPELMSAAEIAEELEISRQRVHQLRETAAFPAPLAELRGGAVWDAAAVRKFASSWERRPGRPKVVRPKPARLQIKTYAPNVIVHSHPNAREVARNPDGGWDVTKPGATRPSAHLQTQAEAVDRARQILRNSGGGELRIRADDGGVRLFEVQAKDN